MRIIATIFTLLMVTMIAWLALIFALGIKLVNFIRGKKGGQQYTKDGTIIIDATAEEVVKPNKNNDDNSLR